MYCNTCNEYRTSEKTKMSYIFWKTVSLFIVYSNCSHEYEKIFKEEEWTETLTIIVLTNDIEQYQKVYNHVWKKT